MNLPLFQCIKYQQHRHDLCNTRRWSGCIRILFIDDPSRRRFHQNRRRRADLDFLSCGYRIRIFRNCILSIQVFNIRLRSIFRADLYSKTYLRSQQYTQKYRQKLPHKTAPQSLHPCIQLYKTSSFLSALYLPTQRHTLSFQI